MVLSFQVAAVQCRVTDATGSRARARTRRCDQCDVEGKGCEGKTKQERGSNKLDSEAYLEHPAIMSKKPKGTNRDSARVCVCVL